MLSAMKIEYRAIHVNSPFPRVADEPVCC